MAEIYTSDERLYLDSAGNVVTHDSPAKALLLVAEGGTLPMDRARELGLVKDNTEAKRKEPTDNKRKQPAENK
jgi:hypothetical protein